MDKIIKTLYNVNRRQSKSIIKSNADENTNLLKNQPTNFG